MRIVDVVAMGALIITILAVLIIAANLQTVANDIDMGADGNQTRTTLFQNTFSGLTLASVGIIVAAGVGLIALILSALAPSRPGPAVA